MEKYTCRNCKKEVFYEPIPDYRPLLENRGPQKKTEINAQNSQKGQNRHAEYCPFCGATNMVD